jgi:hypothetical protein
LLTRKLFYGAAVACAAGLGLGIWLQPPKFYYGSPTPVAAPPPEQPNPWLQDVGASPISPNQSVTDPNADQSAAVSPPAVAQPIQVAQQTDASAPTDDRAQVVASGDTSQAQPDPPGPASSRVVWTQQQRRYDSRPDQDRYQNRDWAAYDSRPSGRDRDNEDYLDSPPPPRWSPPPDRRGSIQDRRWDFRADGSAVPVGDDDDGG